MRTTTRTLTIVLATTLLIPALVALAQEAPTTQPAEPAEPGVTRAMAVMQPTDGNAAAGAVVFEQTDEGIRVTATLTGLAPGNHGFHVHEYGDCSAADGTSAGGHFNPAGAMHAGPDADVRHVGDLGNITANEAGVAAYERLDAHLTFEGEHSILGRGLIVHAAEDDLTTQPTGAAGARIACGVIGVAAGATE